MKHAIFRHHIPDKRQAECYDCFHCQAALGWWCTNKEACKARGTTFAGICKCPYWKPAKMLYEFTKKELRAIDYIMIDKEDELIRIQDG